MNIDFIQGGVVINVQLFYILVSWFSFGNCLFVGFEDFFVLILRLRIFWLYFLGFVRFCESIVDYVVNVENVLYFDIIVDRFYGEIFLVYDILFIVWIKVNELKVFIIVCIYNIG